MRVAVLPIFLSFGLGLLPAGSTAAPEATSVATEDVEFTNGEIRFAGRLYLPAGAGPRPCVVFTHGSGDAGRDNPRYRLEAEYLARAGIASLLFDKRGSGESTGDWRTATFDDLAGDAIAAVQFLKSRQEIDASRIGLRGASQSGWILPIAARRSPDIAFLILISPPGVTPYEQVLYDVRTDVEDAGYPPHEAEKAVALTRSGLDYARTWMGWEAHRRALEHAAEEGWFSLAAGPPDPQHWLWKWVHAVLDFDAIPIVETLDIPTLVLLGERDRETPSQVAGYRLQHALQKSGARFLVRYFPDADHDLRNVGEASAGEERPPLVKGYLQAMRDWVLASDGQ